MNNLINSDDYIGFGGRGGLQSMLYYWKFFAFLRKNHVETHVTTNAGNEFYFREPVRLLHKQRSIGIDQILRG
jgi:hypothetical protein